MKSSFFAFGVILALGLMLAGSPSGQAWAAEKKGLSVSPDGVLIKDGKPYRGIGANYFSAFERWLVNPQDTSYREGFKVLGRRKIPFVRVMAGGFYPNDYRLYLQNKEAYLRQLDDLVKAAEENHVGIIASLFFASAYIPDVVGEHIDQWGNPKSKTHAFMRQYVQDVVGRYKDSPAIWGWEFGNEFALSSDLPGAANVRPPIVPHWGTPTFRTEADELTHDMIVTAFVEFAKAVRQIDPDRIILSGNAVPRSSAYHNTLNRSWTRDTRAQYAQILLRDNPDPLDTVTVHIYSGTNKDYFGDGPVTMDEFLKANMEMAASVKKPLILGEFGAGVSMGPEAERRGITELIGGIEKSKLPLAAIWDFDGVSHDWMWVKEWSITDTNARAYMLDLVSAANERIQKAMSVK